MSSGDDRFDGMLLALAQQTGGIEPLLEAIFGFLGRKTDFYKFHKDPKVAEDLVVKVFRSHQDRALQKERHAEEERAKLKAKEALIKQRQEAEKRKRDEEAEQRALRAKEEAARARQAAASKTKTAAASSPTTVQKQADFGIEEIESDEEEEEEVENNTAEAMPDATRAEGDSKAEPADGEDESANTESKGQTPNAGNGGSGPGYTWTQTLADLEVQVPVLPGTRGRQLNIDIARAHLIVGVKGEEPIIDGKFFAEVNASEAYWVLDEGTVIITLEKANKMEWWDCLITGHPTIDTSKVEPENSKLSDLDGDTRGVVEKMMYDQRQKAAGLPTSEEQEKQRIMEQFMAAHPEMDFSQAKIQ
mmetsp:Transcript_1025/g.3168  ORF Transcript_1025/g.3168 Transcript_1025/m.3168 type:complete len:361 (-) Transcript_1025:1545-2627(-)